MEIFETIKKKLSSQGLILSRWDFERPWGGFFVIDESQAQEFSDFYFDGLDTAPLRIAGKLSPKILMVKPHARLSWQYHHRRAETWRVIQGPVGIVRSNTDVEGEVKHYMDGDIIVLEKGERHRLVGLDDWGVVAEFWQHTDINNPSNEDDIIRLQDDYSRE